MSTRSRVGLVGTGGKVRSVYVHFDGYLDGVGKVLQKHYTTPEKIEGLLALGAISSLGPELGEAHSFNTREPNQTTAYHRDRGEALSIQEDTSVETFEQEHAAEWAEWWYLWRDGRWVVREPPRVASYGGHSFQAWTPLEEAFEIHARWVKEEEGEDAS